MNFDICVRAIAILVILGYISINVKYQHGKYEIFFNLPLSAAVWFNPCQSAHICQTQSKLTLASVAISCTACCKINDVVS